MVRGAFFYLEQASEITWRKFRLANSSGRSGPKVSRRFIWPSAKDTRRTAIMVLIMTSALAIFFLGTDSTFSAIVQYLLGLLG